MLQTFKISEDLWKQIEDLKNKKYRCLSFKFNTPYTELELDVKLGPEATLNGVISKCFPKNDSRFILLDFPCPSLVPNDFLNLFLIMWVPDSARVKEKMVFSSFNANFKFRLNVFSNYQTNELSDLDEKKKLTNETKKKKVKIEKLSWPVMKLLFRGKKNQDCLLSKLPIDIFKDLIIKHCKSVVVKNYLPKINAETRALFE